MDASYQLPVIRKTDKNLAGFTLIELLIVVIIISILALVGFANYASVSRNSRDARRRADLEQVRAALEMYRTDNELYPDDTEAAGYDDLYSILVTGVYMSNFPQDPQAPAKSYGYNGATGVNYVLCAVLENPNWVNNCSVGACPLAGGNYCVANPL
jgi:general secretion pathway protein G